MQRILEDEDNYDNVFFDVFFNEVVGGVDGNVVGWMEIIGYGSNSVVKVGFIVLVQRFDRGGVVEIFSDEVSVIEKYDCDVRS